MRILFVCFISLSLLSSPLLHAEDKSAKRLEDVQTEIESLSKSFDKTKKTKNELYQQLEKQSRVVSKLNRNLHTLKQQLQDKRQQLSSLELEQKQYRQSHAKQLTALSEQLRSAYINAQPNYLKLLLSQQQPSKLSRSSVYFEYFHQARQQQLAEIDSSLQSLSKQQQTLLAAQQQLQQLHSQQQQQQTLLKQQNQQRLATAQQLELKMTEQGDRLKSLREQEQTLQNLLSALAEPKSKPSSTKKTVSRHFNFAKNKGTLTWPINGKITARYGSSRNIGKLTWQGIMIKAPSGNEVVSAAPGQVVFSDWLRGFGLLLIIDHGNKYMTLYGNNQGLLKEVGDNVSTGDIIALSGDKGIKQHAGLYFEIRHKGSPTNPAKWLGKQR